MAYGERTLFTPLRKSCQRGLTEPRSCSRESLGSLTAAHVKAIVLGNGRYSNGMLSSPFDDMENLRKSRSQRVLEKLVGADEGGAELDDHAGMSVYLDQWYKRFKVQNTLRYVWRVSRWYFFMYLLWTLVSLFFFPKWVVELEDGFVLKVLCFLVGFLISLTLRDSLDRYRDGLAALIDFRDEFRSFWYFAQLPLLRHPSGCVIFDIHMVLYAVSLARYLLRGSNVRASEVVLVIHPKFRDCTLFEDGGVYGSITSSPMYAEFLLVSWLRAMGVYDNDLRGRLEYARIKLHRLLTSQCVRLPYTGVHLLRATTHLLLMAVPICSGSLTTKLLLPLVSGMIFALIRLAEELEDPFGFDEHDLPWPVLFRTITTRAMPLEQDTLVKEVIRAFNHACKYEWDTADAKRLFGEGVRVRRSPGEAKTIAYDSGLVDLSIYPNEATLRQLDIVGKVSVGASDSDVLFSHLFEEDHCEELTTTSDGEEEGTTLLSDADLAPRV